MKKSNKSELLAKVLFVLKNKKAGKNIVRDFTQFVIEYEELKKSFNTAFP